MDPFIAEIRIFGGNFAPLGWAMCNGQILAINQNTALFSLLGTTYGGDGRTTFALPNLQGSVPIGQGQGPGLSQRSLGETGGSPTVTLTAATLPAHNHTLNSADVPGSLSGPQGNVLARSGAGALLYGSPPNANMNPASLDFAGSSQPHDNMQPYQVLNYIIAMQGVYPARSTPQDAPSQHAQGSPTHG